MLEKGVTRRRDHPKRQGEEACEKWIGKVQVPGRIGSPESDYSVVCPEETAETFFRQRVESEVGSSD